MAGKKNLPGEGNTSFPGHLRHLFSLLLWVNDGKLEPWNYPVRLQAKHLRLLKQRAPEIFHQIFTGPVAVVDCRWL